MRTLHLPLVQEGVLMVAPAVEGIDLFKVAGRSISGWIPSFKTGAVGHVRQPVGRTPLAATLEYHPQVVSYARRDIGPQFASTYRLPTPKNTPFAIGYTFEAVTGRTLGCTKKNICAILLEAQRFLSLKGEQYESISG